MIKSNRRSEQVILRSGHRKRLKQYEESSSIGQQSQINKLLEGESKVRTEIENVNKDSRSVSERHSAQRAFNSKATQHFIKHTNHHKPQMHAESQVQPFIFAQNQFHHRQQRLINICSRSVQRHPSQPITLIQRRSSSDSEVNTQIQTLNRLMQEYEILKKVTGFLQQKVISDDQNGGSDDKIQNQQQINDKSERKVGSKLMMKKQSQISQRYSYELHETVPIIETKSPGKLSRQMKYKETKVKSEEKQEWNPQKLKLKDKDKQTSKTKSRLMEKEDQKEWRQIKEDDFSLSDSSDDDERIITNRKAEQGIKPVTTTLSLPAQRQPLNQQSIKTTNNTTQQLMTQITKLQTALTQSALKIQQLLLQTIRNKQKLRSYEQLQQKHLRIQSYMRVLRQSESYLNRQLQMREDENKRTEKRCRLMKERVEILQDELKRKDGELERLESKLREYRDRQLMMANNAGIDSEKIAVNNKVQSITATASQPIVEQNIRLKKQLSEQQIRLNQFMQSINHQSASQLQQAKSYYLQLNSQLQGQVKATLQQNYSLRNEINRLAHESRSQQLRSSRKIQHQSPKKHEISPQKQQTKTYSVNNKNNTMKQMYQTLLSSQVQEIKQQLSKLQQFSVSQLQSKQIITQLLSKIRQLQETTQQQQVSKQHFIQQIQTVRSQCQQLQNELMRLLDENNKLKQQDNALRLQNGQCRMQLNFVKTNELQSIKREHGTIKNQLQNIKRQLSFTKNELQTSKRQLHQLKSTTVPRQHYLLLQTQKRRLSQQLQSIQRQRLSTMSLQDQQLYINLTTIKEQYMKLQAAYLQKAKEYQDLRTKVESQRKDRQQLQRQLQIVYRESDNYQQQNNQLHHQLLQAQMKIKQNSIKNLQLTSLSQSSIVYKQRLQQLQQQIVRLQLQLGQKQSSINQLSLKNKQLLLQTQLNKNTVRFTLSSQQEVNTSKQQKAFYQQLKLTQLEVHDLKNQLQIKSQQIKQQQQHHQSILHIQQEAHQKQLSLLQEQIYQLLQEKGVLLNESVRIAMLQQVVYELKAKQKQHNKLTQGISHLWMVKQAEYQNINQILNININHRHNQKLS